MPTSRAFARLESSIENGGDVLHAEAGKVFCDNNLAEIQHLLSFGVLYRSGGY